MNIYDVRLRLPSRSIKVQLNARNIGDAKALARLQYGSAVQTVICTGRVA